MALDFASKLAGYMLGPIGREISYVINYESNVENLKEQVNQLTGARERVECSVDEAKRNGDEIYQYVYKWLNSVTKITKEAGEFIVEDDKAMTRCLNGLCPNLKSRYQLSKKAEKIMEAVVNLKGEGDFPSVSYRVPSPGIWSTSIEGYMALESRMAALKEIMEALRSSNLSVIGVYGMGGVGKTTLVEQVARKAKEDKLFDQVVMASVKETPNVEKIQTTIADKLGLKFDEGSQSGRADRLWHRLKEEQKILVILDDIFTALILKEIGIPFGDDHKGCKILLTSRYQDVLSREMGTQKDFRVEILPEHEAWNLLEKTVGDVVNDAKVRPVAIEVAKRCLGLPVLIVPVAKVLRNGSLYDWMDALKNLERFDSEEEMTAKVFAALELCYNHLKGEEVKSLFLICGQLCLHNIPILDLLKYSLGLGIFKKINDLKEARNRVHKLVKDLKASCLLLEGEMPMSVKMHDFVHDFAISIAFRDHHVFSVDHNSELNEWPTKDMLQQCTSISFIHSTIHDLPEELQCPQVKSFILYNEEPSLKIPDNFFKGMEKLNVLDLTTVHLLSLPISLQFLENLRTLCLDYCVLGDIAALGELKKLEILSLIASNIVQLPTEIGKLTRLLLLDLSRCSKLEVISPGVLSSLSQLEDLYMGENSFVQWEIEESNSRRSSASLTELMNLPNLISLDIHIPDAKILPEEFFSKCKRLERYKILIGDELDWSGMYRTSRMLKLKLHLSFHMEYGVKMLLKETEDLHLHELKGAENILFDLDGEGFPLLKHLSVQNSPEILYIINSEGRLSCNVFPILESLILDKLINLAKICHGQLTVGSFAKLKSIKVESCHKLRYLFSISLASGLRQLQEIEVTECEIMEEIVAHRREDDANYNAAIEFTRLHSLTLKHLPRLTRFSSIAKMPSASQRGQKLLTSDTRSKEIVSEDELTTPTLLFNEKIVFPNLEFLKLISIDIKNIWDDQLRATSFHFQNLTQLIVDGCGNLKYLFSTSMVGSLVKLQNLEIWNCKLMERVIVTEKEGMIKMRFPKLVRLRLKNLPKLTKFCFGNFIEFPALSTLWIENCPDLKTFISNSICTGIMESKEVEEMKLEENLDADKQAFFDDKVVFPNLEDLRVDGCGSLKYLFSTSMVGSLVKLQELEICSCKFMEGVIVTEKEEGMIKMRFPKLVRLRLKNLPKLTKFCFGNFIEFPALSTRWIENCPDLKTFISNSICTSIMESKKVEEMKLEENLDADKQAFFDDKVVFPNLEDLRVDGCGSLKYLCSTSMVGSLVKLQELEICCCKFMEGVIVTEKEEGMIKMRFPKLVRLRLKNLPKLTKFCFGNFIEFPALSTLWIENCLDLKTFISNSICTGIMESKEVEQMKLEENLDADKQAFFDDKVVFPNLEDLRVDGCGSLKYLFSTSMVGSLVKLQELEICSCKFMEGVIVTGKEKGMIKMRFPKLVRLTLKNLPKLTKFCFENFIEFPALSTLWIENCPDLKTFISNSICTGITESKEAEEMKLEENLDADKQAFFDDKVVFPNLEDLRVDGCGSLKYLFSTSMVGSLVKLQELEICSCKFMEGVIVTEKEEGMIKMRFPKLVRLRLKNLPKLTKFCFGNFIEFPALSTRWIENCPDLKTFISNSICTSIMESKKVEEMKLEENLDADKQAFFDDKVVFPNLEDLRVDGCGSLKYLFSTSMVGSLVKLQELEICSCKFMEGVIVTEKEEGMIKMRFPKLVRLRLKNLPKLTKFCFGNFIEFPALSTRWIENCPDLKTFISNSICTSIMESKKVEEMKLEENLDADKQAFFDDKVVFPNLEDLRVDGCGSLKYLFSTSMVRSLVKLQELEICCCKFMEGVIVTGKEKGMIKMRFPKLVRLTLKNLPKLTKFCFENFIEFPALSTLWIENCPDLKTFISNSICTGITESKEAEEMKLEENLDADKQAFFDDKVVFPNLEDLRVDGCGSLKYLFSTSMVGSLVKLQELEICSCKFMEGVIVTGKEKGMIKMRFPKLVRLRLKNLPKLTKFCFENFIEFPALSTLWIENCLDLKTFISNSICTSIMESKEVEQMKLEENLDADKQAFFDDKVVFPNLEDLRVDGCGSLKYLFSTSMVGSLVKLQELEICSCKFMEGVIVTGKEKGMIKMRFPKLVRLRLKNLPKLTKFCFENFIEFPALSTLWIENCPDLKTFISNSIRTGIMESKEAEEMKLEENLDADKQAFFDDKVVFPNLEDLRVDGCGSLKYLFSTSMVGSLVKLQELEICSCKFMEGVIVTEKEEGMIKMRFPKLVRLRLKNLSKLTKFCFGNFIEFPALSTRWIENCPDLKTFISNSICTGIMESKEVEEMKLEENLDADKQAFFDDKVVFPNLEDLRVDGCGSLMYLFSTSMVGSLVKLQELEICSCKFMEGVIVTEKEEGMIKMRFPKLVRLRLKNLPKLTKFCFGNFIEFPALSTLWIENCPDLKTFISNSICTGIMESKEVEEMKLEENLDADKQAFFDDKVVFPNLEDLRVDGCGSLKYLFSTSMVGSLVKLQELEICCCKFMEGVIVTEKEDGMIKMRFPKLVRPRLKNLPKLTKFCFGNFIEFPALSTLCIENCPDLKTFISNSICTGIMESKEVEEMKPEENLDADKQAFFDDKVVFPNLEDLIVDGCGSLKYLFSTSMVGSLVKLRELEICNCKFMEGVIVTEKEEGMIKMLFPKLEILNLQNLSKLTRFCSENFIEFPTLDSMHVENCPDLKTFISNSICRDIMASEEHEEMNLHADKQAFFDDKNVMIFEED